MAATEHPPPRADDRWWPSAFGPPDEHLLTARLAADGVRRFALILTHPELRGVTGAWTSPIALV